MRYPGWWLYDRASSRPVRFWTCPLFLVIKSGNALSVVQQHEDCQGVFYGYAAPQRAM